MIEAYKYLCLLTWAHNLVWVHDAWKRNCEFLLLTDLIAMRLLETNVCGDFNRTIQYLHPIWYLIQVFFW